MTQEEKELTEHIVIEPTPFQSPVDWLLNWMRQNEYFIGNDLLEAVKEANDMDESDSVEDYNQGYSKGWTESNKKFKEDIERLRNKYNTES